MQTPPWANGGREWRWAPTNPQDYANFVEAASRRYPQVRHWMIWSEPTKAENFQPLSPDGGRDASAAEHGAVRALRADARSRLCLAEAREQAQSRHRQQHVHRRDGLAAAVDPGAASPNGKPPRMDLYGHNPFSARVPKLSQAAARPRLRGLVGPRHAHRVVRPQPPAPGPEAPQALPVRGVDSDDHANREFNFFVSQKTQARWIRAALRITRSSRGSTRSAISRCTTIR